VLGEAATFSEHLRDKHEFQAHSQEGSVAHHSMLNFKNIPVFQETLLLLLPLLSTSFLGLFPYPKLGKKLWEQGYIFILGKLSIHFPPPWY